MVHHHHAGIRFAAGDHFQHLYAGEQLRPLIIEHDDVDRPADIAEDHLDPRIGPIQDHIHRMRLILCLRMEQHAHLLDRQADENARPFIKVEAIRPADDLMGQCQHGILIAAVHAEIERLALIRTRQQERALQGALGGMHQVRVEQQHRRE